MPEQLRIAYTPREAAAALGVSARQVGRWCATWRKTRGRAGLRHSRLGPRCVRILPADLGELLRRASNA
jgi:transposase-like protein